jgi:hypothetical protein
MGKKLTYGQRLQRDRERENDRQRRAAEVASRRAAEKRQRERELQNEKNQKEAAMQAQMKYAKSKVNSYEKFVNDISRLHLNGNNISSSKFHTKFSKLSQFEYSGSPKPKEPEKVAEYNFQEIRYVFKPRIFKFVDEAKLVESTRIVSLSFDQYCAAEKKNKFNLGTWVLYFLFLFPIAFLHYSVAKKNYVSNSEYKKIIIFHKEQMARLNAEKSSQYEKFVIEENKRKAIEPGQFKESEEKRKLSEELAHTKAKNKYDLDLAQYKTDLDKYTKKYDELLVQHNQNEDIKLKWYTNLSVGNQKEVEEMLELLFPLRFDLDEDFVETDPSDVEVGFNFIDSESIELVVVADKELSYIPKTGYKLTASGKDVSEFNLTQKAFNDYSNACISSLALGYLKNVFEFCNSIKNVKLEICIPGVNKKTGDFDDEVILQLKVDRYLFDSLKLANIDPTEAITNFQFEFKKMGGKGAYINSFIEKENVLWFTVDDSNLSLTDYVKVKFDSTFN